MPPWDLVATGLQRFLRLGYVATTVSGAVLVAEIVVLAIDGPPAHRRDLVRDWVTAVPHWHVKTSLLVLLVGAGLVGAYFVGAAARFVAVAAFTLVTFVYHVVYSPFANARRRRAERRAARKLVIHPPHRVSTVEYVLEEVGEIWDGFRRRILIPIYFGLRSVIAPVFPLRLKSAAVWAALDGQFGREAVARVLERHPITVRQGDDEYKIIGAFPYCQMWLQRYTPDVAISRTAKRTVVLLAAIPPAVLLPSTLHALATDVSAVRPWLGWTWVVLVLAVSIAVINSLREGSLVALSTFYRFVLLQFVEEGRPLSRDGIAT
jgi:hypothetical protein